MNFTLIYYATQNLGFSSFFGNCLSSLDWSFFFLLAFVGFLFEVAFLNTIFLSIPVIKNKIQLASGSEFIKNRGYNSRFNPLLRIGNTSMILAWSRSSAFLGASVGQIVEVNHYTTNSKEYVSAQIENPNLNLKPPERASLLNFPFSIGK